MIREGSPDTATLIDALGSAGSARAQEVLQSVVREDTFGDDERRRALISLSMAEQPSAETIALLQGLTEDPVYGKCWARRFARGPWPPTEGSRSRGTRYGGVGTAADSRRAGRSSDRAGPSQRPGSVGEAQSSRCLRVPLAGARPGVRAAGQSSGRGARWRSTRCRSGRHALGPRGARSPRATPAPRDLGPRREDPSIARRLEVGAGTLTRGEQKSDRPLALRYRSRWRSLWDRGVRTPVCVQKATDRSLLCPAGQPSHGLASAPRRAAPRRAPKKRPIGRILRPARLAPPRPSRPARLAPPVSPRPSRPARLAPPVSPRPSRSARLAPPVSPPCLPALLSPPRFAAQLWPHFASRPSA